jgi:hypothetical protein
MKYLSFRHYLIAREGALVPDKAPATRLPRLNATPFTSAERKRLKPKPVAKLAPVRPMIPQVVPNHLIPQNLDPSGTSLVARVQSAGG